jgi:hypothetical protein
MGWDCPVFNTKTSLTIALESAIRPFILRKALPMQPIRLASRFLLPLLLLAAAVAVAASRQPVYVGNTAAQAIRMGMLIAMCKEWGQSHL